MPRPPRPLRSTPNIARSAQTRENPRSTVNIVNFAPNSEQIDPFPTPSRPTSA